MNKLELQQKLYISTTAVDVLEQAAMYDLGIELAQFSYAPFLDENYEKFAEEVRFMQQVSERMIYHAPFNEIYPAAIDPRAKAFAMGRLQQAYRSAASFGIRRMVVHSGYEPMVYFPQWYREKAADFFREFMEDKPEDFSIMIENQMESGEDLTLLPQLVEKIDDRRVGLTLDIGHAMYRGWNRDLKEWIDAFAPWTTHIHLHQNDHSWDWHQTLDEAGANDVDIEEILLLLMDKIKTATITLEHAAAAGSVNWLETKGYLQKKDPEKAHRYAGYEMLSNRFFGSM